MEYGLRIATLDSGCKSPADFCDGALSELCPDAPLTALYFGTEFCQELLPGIRETEAFCEYCSGRGLDAVLLTPMVTHRGLTRLDRLFEGLTSRGWIPAVVFNDWGVLELLRTKHPS
jgi:hypothetical protein